MFTNGQLFSTEGSVQKPAKLLNLLQERLQRTSRLYAVYSETFLDFKGFWEELSKEKVQHAIWLVCLQSQIEDDSSRFASKKFSIAEITKSLDFVDECITKAHAPDFQLVTALSTALKLEDSLINNKYFEAFEDDTPEVKRMLFIIKNATQRHLIKIRKVWQENYKSLLSLYLSQQ